MCATSILEGCMGISMMVAVYNFQIIVMMNMNTSFTNGCTICLQWYWHYSLAKCKHKPGIFKNTPVVASRSYIYITPAVMLKS